MTKLTLGKLRAWHRRAVALDNAAKRLMADMIDVIGCEDAATDPVDNVTDQTENLCDILSRPELDIWKPHFR